MALERSQDNGIITRRNALRIMAASGVSVGATFVAQSLGKEPANNQTLSSDTLDSYPPELPDSWYLKELKSGPDIIGHARSFGDAFSALKISLAVPLFRFPNRATFWAALSVVGLTNELQIVDLSRKKTVYSLNLPDGVGNGIDSMVWDMHRNRLYLSVGAHILLWNPEIPSKFEILVIVSGASAVYEIHLDSKGDLWGGLYPLGAVFRYSIALREITIYDRLADDTDYVRRLIIDDKDRLWLGTGSVNPRLFTLDAHSPETVTEIKLPTPQPNGFIGSLNLIGSHLAVSVSSVSGQLILDTHTKLWKPTETRVWDSRIIVAGDDKNYFTVSGGILYESTEQQLAGVNIGSVSSRDLLLLWPMNDRVMALSQISGGVKLEIFDMETRRVGRSYDIKMNPSSLRIHSVMSHTDGNIYMGGFRANCIASLNPDTNIRWNSEEAESVINQVEGMIQFDESRSFIGSYGGADIISMTTEYGSENKEFDLIGHLATKFSQSRPFGWARNSKNIFFGTVPGYGISGGALGMVDPYANKIQWIVDGNGEGFIRHHSIIGLAADDRFVYGTTSVRNGYGIPDTEGPARVFKVDISTQEIIWESSPIKGAGALYAPSLIAGLLIIADLQGIALLDPHSGALKKRITINSVRNSAYRPGWLAADLVFTKSKSQAVHAAAGQVTVMDFLNHRIHRLVSLKETDQYGTRLTVSEEDRVYGVLNQTQLVELSMTKIG